MNIAIKPENITRREALAGKVSLVTGSTSGIGLGIARALAAAGSEIVLNGFGRPEEVADVQARIAAEFGVPMETVQRWIDEERKTPPQEGLALLEMLKRANLEFCARCGGELGFDIPISSCENDKYHADCFKKMLSR